MEPHFFLEAIPATPTDDIISAVVLLGTCTPFVAFWDNPGETPTIRERLVEFGFIWLLMSGLAQTLWELPWWLLDITGVVHNIGPEDTWLWPWWASDQGAAHSSAPAVELAAFAARHDRTRGRLTVVSDDQSGAPCTSAPAVPAS